jgi:uncharacterized protein (TIGR00251 family)
MLIKVKAHAGSKQEKVKEIANNELEIWVHARPTEGAANNRIIELLARHFKIPKSSITLKSGAKSKIKVFNAAK